MNNTKQLYSFSQTKYFKLFANHGEKAFYFILLIGILFTYQDLKGQFLIDVIFLVSALSLILLVFAKLIAKVIWRFDIDFDKEIISFYICRRVSPILIEFTKIDQIKVSGPVIFLIKNKKFYYSTNQIEVLKTLQRVKKIKWGKMCNVLGPTKSIQDTVNQGVDRDGN